MKVIGTILKILAALAAIAGAVYVIATYGDKIVAWAKSLLNKCCCEAAPAEEVAPAEETVSAEEADFEG